MGWFSRSKDSEAAPPPDSAASTSHAGDGLSPRAHTTPVTDSAASAAGSTTSPTTPNAADAAPAQPEAPLLVTVPNAFRTLRPSDFVHFYKAPCVRDSLLVGLVSGFGIGGLRMVLGGMDEPFLQPDRLCTLKSRLYILHREKPG